MEVLEIDGRGTRLAVEIVLQDDGGGRGIEQRFALAPVLLTQREPAFGLAARQAFVLQHHRHLDNRAQTRGDRFDGRRARYCSTAPDGFKADLFQRLLR